MGKIKGLEKGMLIYVIKDKLKGIENVLTELVNSFESGYVFTKNCRTLVEKLTEYKKTNPHTTLNLTLGVKK